VWYCGAGVSVRRVSVQEERDEELEQQAEARAAKPARPCCSKAVLQQERLAARPSVFLSCCKSSLISVTETIICSSSYMLLVTYVPSSQGLVTLAHTSHITLAHTSHMTLAHTSHMTLAHTSHMTLAYVTYDPGTYVTYAPSSQGSLAAHCCCCEFVACIEDFVGWIEASGEGRTR
jgi:hypothetical protein